MRKRPGNSALRMGSSLQFEVEKKQLLIDQRRREVCSRYPPTWKRIIADWHRDGGPDRLYLIYAANYLFQTHGTRWAIDPLTPAGRVPGMAPMDVSEDLGGLAFVLLTHRHADHLDIDLMRSLRNVPITWVVPADSVAYVREQAGIVPQNILVPKAGYTLNFNGLVVLPFEGLHWEMVGTDTSGKPIRKGVPSVGYLVKCGGRSWLFPGDVRDYDLKQLPKFGPVDVVFAHLWLGRHCALQGHPPLLEPFCDFFLHWKPHRIIVTHLEEVGRKADDYWDRTHFEMIAALIKKRATNVGVEMALTGDCLEL
jgi:hypothetical protein